MQIFSKSHTSSELGLLSEMPIKIEYRAGHTAIATYRDGSTCSIGCIKCKNPRCLYFEQAEISCEKTEVFSGDNDLSACSVGAIVWDEVNNQPLVDNVKCIKCGVCMRRCPVAAIYFDGDIRINNNISSKQVIVERSESYIEVQNSQIDKLLEIKKQGMMLLESDSLLCNIYNKLMCIHHSFHNLIARNLLVSVGNQCVTRRIGDVYTRMDAVFNSLENTFGVVEVEFGKDTLEASRAILDDIAVLHSRYGIDKHNNIPLVVCVQLPNARQGYWQVVKDVKNVEGIQIQTITIGALMLLNWNNEVAIFDGNNYYVDYDSMSLRQILEQQLGRTIQLSDKHLGILEPNK